MEHVTLDPANNLGTVEHRTCARLTVSSLIFVKLGAGNGGIALNISEGGLALSAANDLTNGRIPELSIQLPGSRDWIRTAGQITWRSNSNKKCGVRFVGMGDDARRRIREWIAAETSSAGPTPEPEGNRAFQNVELESTAPTPGDTVVSMGKEDKDASNAPPAAEVGGHSALQETQPESKSAVATDATVLTKEKDEDKVVADRCMLTARVFPVNPYNAEAVLDRRFHPRKRIIPLGYVQLGDKNGGIALNVSEGGFSIIAANVLPEDNLPSIRLQFPEKTRWVDVKGEIVWRRESKKEAGVRFVDLPEQARLQLRNWLSSPAPPLAVERQTELIRRREKTELPPTALSAPELLSRGPIPDSSPTDNPPIAKRPLVGRLRPEWLYGRYGLRENPFGMTPNPRYWYESQTHAEARSSLIAGIECGAGFQALIAPPGMGKTTILLSVLELFKDVARTAFLFQTQGDSRDFLRYLLLDLGYPAHDADRVRMQDALNQLLIREHRAGRHTLIVIDEAQSLDVSVLETIRLLSNFETPSEKLLQIILAGQPPLAQRLANPELAQLSQRISILRTLVPFGLQDTINYIDHRLHVAGYQGAPLFTPEAVKLIWERSGGIPRDINTLCFNALLLARAVEQPQIDVSILHEVIADREQKLTRLISDMPATGMEDKQLGEERKQEIADPSRATRAGTGAVPEAAIQQLAAQPQALTGTREAGCSVEEQEPKHEPRGTGVLSSGVTVAAAPIASRLEPQAAAVANPAEAASSPTRAEAIEKAPESFPPPVVEIFSDVSSLTAAHPRVESRARSQPVKRHPRVIRARIKGGSGWKKPGVLFPAWIATVALLVLVGLPPLKREWLSSRPQGTKRIVKVVTPKQALGTEIAGAAPQSPPASVATASQPQRPEAPQGPNGKPALPKNGASGGMPTITLKDLLGRGEGAQRPLAATAAKEPVRSLQKSLGLNQGNIESSAPPVSVTNPTLPGEPPRVASAPPAPWPHEEARLAPALIPVVSPPRNAEATGSEKNSTKNSGEGPALPKSTEPAVRINGTVAITTDPYPSIRFSGKRNGKKSRGGTSLRLGQLLSRVEPAYPEEAMQKGVQGTVKIHVIVSPEGSIERLVSVDGPPSLVPATVRAVQQWRYSQTLLAGHPVETEDNIAVTFGLSTGINR